MIANEAVTRASAVASTKYPLTDALGSVYATTDSAGAVAHRYDYDVWGVRTDLGGSGPGVDFGYTGRWHDANGLVDHRDRLRNPRLGVWLQPDPAGSLVGPNQYTFALDPANQRDPNGLYVCTDTVSCTALVDFPYFLLIIGVESWTAYESVTHHPTDCPVEEDDDPEPEPLYRGLAKDDLPEVGIGGGASSFTAAGQIRSYAMRGGDGLDIISLKIRDDASIEAHGTDPRSPPSPWVSATKLKSKAEFFASHGNSPGFYVASFVTSRVHSVPFIKPKLTNYVDLGNADQELLFPGFVGPTFDTFLSFDPVKSPSGVQ